MPEIAKLRCSCGCADLIAIAPGDEEESVELLGTKLLIRVGMPLRAWCVSCWPCAVAVAEVVP